MTTPPLHVDGNAVAGAFGEVLGFDVSTAALTCAGCSRAAVFAEAHVYMRGPGIVVRCPSCQAVLVRLVRRPNDACLDFRGALFWRVPVSGS
jgi:hypothetical protein